MRNNSHKAFVLERRANPQLEIWLSFTTNCETAFAITDIVKARTQTQDRTILVETEERIAFRVDVLSKNFHLLISWGITIDLTICEIDQVITDFFCHLLFTSFLFFYKSFSILNLLLRSHIFIISSKHLLSWIFWQMRPETIVWLHTLFVPPISTVHTPTITYCMDTSSGIFTPCCIATPCSITTPYYIINFTLKTFRRL